MQSNDTAVDTNYFLHYKKQKTSHNFTATSHRKGHFIGSDLTHNDYRMLSRMNCYVQTQKF